MIIHEGIIIIQIISQYRVIPGGAVYMQMVMESYL